MRNIDDDRVPFRRPSVKKYVCLSVFIQNMLQNFTLVNIWMLLFMLGFSLVSLFFYSYRPANRAAAMDSRDGDFDLDISG